MTDSLTLAVVSDLHVSTDKPSHTYIVTEPPAARKNLHPLVDLQDHVADLTADYLVSAGDMIDQADIGAAAYTWNRLQDIKAGLGAADLIATTGNHDLQTHSFATDPALALRSLGNFPTAAFKAAQSYWEDGVGVIEEDRFRVVLLNSCHGFPPHPGAGSDPDQLKSYKDSIDRGYFTEKQEEILEAHLASTASSKLNLLLCHHHPLENERLRELKDSYGPMNRGGDLIQLLESRLNVGRWFLIHGHKHLPRLVAAGGSARSPILFGSASLGHKLWHPVATMARNQFHLIKFDMSADPALPALRGTVRSWKWSYGNGWVAPSEKGDGLPARCGFGYPLDPAVLAKKIANLIPGTGRAFLEWEAVAGQVPEVMLQMPEDFDLMESQLMLEGISLQRDRTGLIVEVARAH